MTLAFHNSPLWTRCSLSGNSDYIARGIAPVAQTDAQREGKAAHWLANMVLRGDSTTAMDGLGETAPNGWLITESMCHHIQQYVEIVTHHGQVIPEQTVSLWEGLVLGRIDAHPIDNPDDEILRIYDLKYGYRIIEPDENPQIILAALALIRPHHRLISLEIFQPRPYHPDGPHRKCMIDLATLAQFEMAYQTAARAALEISPTATPGHHCADHYCPKAAVCTALAANIGRVYDMLGKPGLSMPDGVTLAAEGDFLELAEKLLKARKTGIFAEIEARVRRGERIGEFMMEQQPGHREWTVRPEMVGVLTGRDPWQDRVVKSPAMMENEGVSKQIVSAISTPATGRMKLTKFNSKKAARLFGK